MILRKRKIIRAEIYKTDICKEVSLSILKIDNLVLANSFFTKLVGLTIFNSISENDGLLLVNCNSIHTFWMRFSIDVIFLNSSLKIINILENFKPFRFSPIIDGAKFVLELKKGAVKKNNIIPNYYLKLM